jgi:membrane-associated phospholipid phosphatase
LIPDPDPRLFLRVNEFARDTPWLHPFMTGYADYGIAVFVALLLAGWWIARRSRDLRVTAAAVWTPLGALAAVALNQPIVTVIDEARPYAVLSNIVVLAHRTSDPSFPSDHAVLAGAVAGGLWLVNRRLGAVAVARRGGDGFRARLPRRPLRPRRAGRAGAGRHLQRARILGDPPGPGLAAGPR